MSDIVGVTDFHRNDGDHIDPTTREWLALDEDDRIVRTPEHEARTAEIGVRVEEWRGTQEVNAGQSRRAGLIGGRIMADAMHPEPSSDYDLDEHPFDALGGCDQARRIFGGRPLRCRAALPDTAGKYICTLRLQIETA